MVHFNLRVGFLISLVAVFSLALAQPLCAGQSGTPGIPARTPGAAEPQAASQALPSPPQVLPTLPVPRLVKFSGAVKDSSGEPRSGVVGLTFSIYKDQQGGSTLWMETHNVELDELGRYSVLLGSRQSEGMPLDLFAAGEPRWLGVKVELPGEVEQARVLLVSVPYALKASDADTLGGKPAAAYALASATGDAATTGASGERSATGAGGTKPTKSTNKAVGNATTATFIPMFLNNSGALGNSVMIQGPVSSGVSSGMGIGVGQNPAQSLDVNGGVRGAGLATGSRNTALDAINTAALFLGGSNAMSLIGTNTAAFAPGVLFTKVSFFAGNGTTTTERITVDGPTGNVGIGMITPGQKLDVAGSVRINGIGNSLVFPDGTVMTSAGAGTNGGTITGVTAGTGLIGGGSSGGVTLGINTTVVPQLGAASNTFTGTLTLPANGLVAGTNQLVLSGGNVGVGLAAPVATLHAQAGATGGSIFAGDAIAGECTVAACAAVDAVTNAANGLGLFATAVGGTGTAVFATTDSGLALDAEGGTGNAIFAALTTPCTGAPTTCNLFTGATVTTTTPSTTTNVVRIDSTGKGFFNGGTQNSGADFAESVEPGATFEHYEPGDVLAIDRSAVRRVTLSSEAYSTLVAGIYSTKPGVLATPYGMDDPRLARNVPLAIVGIVPCKVSAENGPIQIGDLLVSSSLPGHAMKGTDRRRMLGAVVGKALQSFDPRDARGHALRTATGMIEVLVALQ